MRAFLIPLIALIVGAGLMYAIPSGWRMRTVALSVITLVILTVLAAWLLLD
jgi:hypothetical protein